MTKIKYKTYIKITFYNYTQIKTKGVKQYNGTNCYKFSQIR